MDLRTAWQSWAGTGAVTNARRSLDERCRAQDEVSALLARLEQGAGAPRPADRTTSPAA